MLARCSYGSVFRRRAQKRWIGRVLGGICVLIACLLPSVALASEESSKTPDSDEAVRLAEEYISAFPEQSALESEVRFLEAEIRRVRTGATDHDVLRALQWITDSEWRILLC